MKLKSLTKLKIFSKSDTDNPINKLRLKIFDFTSYFRLSKYCDNPISKAKLKFWYFTNFTINPKVIFLRMLNRRLPGWLLSVYSNRNGKVVFGLTPTWGPLLIGDEMGINDPIISIDNICDAYYGFNGGLSECSVDKIIPNDIREWKKIWDKAIFMHAVIRGSKNEVYCPEHKISMYGGLTKEGKICPECFGLGSIFTYGSQKELGEKLLQGSDITIIGRQATIKFQPEGLSALLSLYDTYHSGIVLEIAQNYLISYALSVIKETFPHVPVFFSYNKKGEPGLCDVLWTSNNETVYRRFYMLQENGSYINLFTGMEAKPSQELTPITSSDQLPGRDRWNVTLEILRNLCKFVK